MPTTLPNVNTDSRQLYIAFELSRDEWKLGFSDSLARPVRIRNVKAGDFEQVVVEVQRAKKLFGLTDDAQLISCYEAGRDGFWIHRVLTRLGWKNHIIEPASVEVSRRSRRVKTDCVDVQKLVAVLIRKLGGEKFACSIIRVPTREDEAARNLHRELDVLTKERTSHINRIKGLLFCQGVRVSEIKATFAVELESMKTGDGYPLTTELKDQLRREFKRLQRVVFQMRELQMQRAQLYRDAMRASEQTELPEGIRIAVKLRQLCGIGDDGAWTIAMELFAWRELKNRRQVAALSGLAPSPFRSGKLSHEQGISKTGRSELRNLLIELAWCWLYFQPDSELTKWFFARYGHETSRQRRVGIVAVARKLLILLWKYQRDEILPAGVRLKKTVTQNNFRYATSLEKKGCATK